MSEHPHECSPPKNGRGGRLGTNLGMMRRNAVTMTLKWPESGKGHGSGGIPSAEIPDIQEKRPNLWKSAPGCERIVQDTLFVSRRMITEL
jgi:hypothetical protein